MRYTVRRMVLLVSLVIAASMPVASAQGRDIWGELMRAMRFAEINRAQLEHDCRENPQFSSSPALQSLCAKRHRIPDGVIENAALPYLKIHVSTEVAKQAIAALNAEPGRTLTRKSIQEIASGKRDQFTSAELELLRRRNESEYGRALSAFASDKEQGIALARAMLAYEP